MKRRFLRNGKTIGVAVSVLALAIVVLFLKSQSGQTEQAANAASTVSHSQVSVDLSPSQLNAIKIEPVGTYLFPVEKEAVGSIDFDEDLSVQVFPDLSGNHHQDACGTWRPKFNKSQPLYTIKSPDLIQAESTLIGAAATLKLTSKELARAQDLGTRSCRARDGTGDLRSTNRGRRSQSGARCRPRLWQDGCRN